MFKKPNMTDLANQEALKKLKNIIELMIQVCPKALYNDSIGGSTVFSEFLSYYSNTSDSVEKNQLKSVLNVVKAAIIGDQNRSHQQRIQDIYPSGIPGMLLLRSICEHENNNEALALKICLDLGPSRAINSRFIDAMVNKVFDGVDFETVLSYVQLPPRQFTASPSAQGGELDTLENYARIFNFLMKDRKVQKIFKIIVNDLIGQPHPDEMITRLVYDFGVEYWDWKKLDMNIETILEAAPNVKEVSLHSSGIYSALQGWASEGGLIVLPKLAMQCAAHLSILTYAVISEGRNDTNRPTPMIALKLSEQIVAIDEVEGFCAVLPSEPPPSRSKELVGETDAMQNIDSS
ncbi:hypothetical protein GGI42DRAFT_360393 [Trichoderma sp. SZMC 28013]